MVTLCLTFQSTANVFSKVATPFYIPNTWTVSSSNLNDDNLFYCNHPRRYAVASQGGFAVHLRTKDAVEFLCNDLLAIRTTPLKKCRIKLFAYFFNWIVFLIFILRVFLILNKSPLLDIWLVNIFSHSVGCAFIFLMMFYRCLSPNDLRLYLHLDHTFRPHLRKKLSIT